jgi:tRNA C32,U32 (ribose-2'-O)-methylase TrmJ
MVLRAAANFGPCEVWVVAPRRPSLLVHPEFEQMAHGVEDVRARCRVVDSLTDALGDCALSIGFTARPRDGRKRRDWRQAVEEYRPASDSADERVALVFGSDEGGLNSAEIAALQELCFLPTSEEHTSINLAMSVGIVLYTLFSGSGARPPERGAHLVDGNSRAYLREHLKSALGARMRSEAARRDLLASIERVFTRAVIENRDARAWHQLLRALGDTSTPAHFGLSGSPRDARRLEALQRAGEAREDEELPGGPQERGAEDAETRGGSILHPQ